MSNTLWNAEVTRVGGDASDMIAAGVLILFGEPVPEALADVSVVHAGASGLSRPIVAGDQFVIGNQTYTVDDLGSRACDNLIELGHVVIYINQPGQDLLPGAVKASGPDLQVPEVGSRVAFNEA